MEFAGRLELTPSDLVHLLHAFHQHIKKFAHGYSRVLIVYTLRVGMIRVRVASDQGLVTIVVGRQPAVSFGSRCRAISSSSLPSSISR